MRRKVLAGMIITSMVLGATACSSNSYVRYEDKKKDVESETAIEKKEKEAEKEEKEEEKEEKEAEKEEKQHDDVEVSEGGEWKQVYIDFFEDYIRKGYADVYYGGYSFVDVDENGVPEIVVHSGTQVAELYWIADGKVCRDEDSYLGDSNWWNPKTKEFISISGNSMDWQSVMIQKLDFDSGLKRTKYANWGKNTEGTNYTIDGKETTKEKYEALIESRIEGCITLGGNDLKDIIEEIQNYDPSKKSDQVVVDEEENMNKEEAKEQSADSINVELEVEKIRKWYYNTQDNLDNYMQGEDPNFSFYYEEGFPVKIVVKSGYDGEKYTREYFYKDKELYFAFVYNKSEEYRFYFKDGELIRYIDKNKKTFDYGNLDSYSTWKNKIQKEAKEIYPDWVNCGA